MHRPVALLALLVALAVVNLPAANARVFGNRPPSGGEEDAAESQRLAEQVLEIMSGIFGALAAYERTGDSAMINDRVSQASQTLRGLAQGFDRLARTGHDFDLSPDAAMSELPDLPRLLSFYGRSPSELSSLFRASLVGKE